jgi:putative aldouronate transport system permease protein
VANGLFMALMCFTMLYPFWNCIVKSFSGNTAIMRGLVVLWPRNFTLLGYKALFSDSSFFQTLKNTLFVTVIGTVLQTWLALSIGYAFSKRELLLHKPLFFVFLFTMFFSGGMIPTFLQIRALHLYDTLWALIFPGSMSVFYMILARSFFYQLPDSIEESAFLDGANYLQIFTRIILPISKPLISTLVIFSSVALWNLFMACVLYIQSSDKYVLQVFVRMKVFNLESATMGDNVAVMQREAREEGMLFGSENLKMATLAVSSVPIICVYPFFQKYFIKGITLGAVKG